MVLLQVDPEGLALIPFEGDAPRAVEVQAVPFRLAAEPVEVEPRDNSTRPVQDDATDWRPDSCRVVDRSDGEGVLRPPRHPAVDCDAALFRSGRSSQEAGVRAPSSVAKRTSVGPLRKSLDKGVDFRYIHRVNPAAGSSSASRLLRDWASRGRYHFSTGEMANELGVSLTATRSALRRLKKKGLVASPYRGFHVVLSPEHQRLGCLPGEQFVPQLMGHLETAYYAGLLTAARYHGAAHQQPQVFQVVVPKNRPPIRCGLVQVDFVARHNTVEMPTRTVNTPRGFLRISAPETTAYDLVGYPEHCGGLDNVATVLAELGEKLNPERLAEIADLSPLPWSQRLGYILDFVEHSPRTERLAGFVAGRATETTPLLPSVERASARRDDRWKLWINADLEPDL